MTIDRPRRLTPPAPPGALLKRITVAAPRRGLAERQGDDPDYLALIRRLPCLYCGLEPCGEAAHVRFASAAFGKASGLGKKPEDRWAVPLCGEDHRLAKHAQHNHNEAAFWEGIGINPLIVASQLHAARGDMPRMVAIVIQAVAERSKQ